MKSNRKGEYVLKYKWKVNVLKVNILFRVVDNCIKIFWLVRI